MIEKPYTLDNKSIDIFLKDLKQVKKEIEKYDWTFEKAGLCNPKNKEEVLNEIEEQIKLCEYYFKTKKRKDLFRWVFQEKYKPNDWNEERDIWTFSSGIVKALIEIYKREKSTEIVSYFKEDSNLYVYFREFRNRDKKILRSDKSIEEYLEKIKKDLEQEIKEFQYDKREVDFYNFILYPIKSKEDKK